MSRYERRAQAAIGGGLLGLAALVARFPRVLAWPLAAAGGSFGAALLHRAIRTPETDRLVEDPIGAYDDGDDASVQDGSSTTNHDGNQHQPAER